jgi:transposase-like protein
VFGRGFWKWPNSVEYDMKRGMNRKEKGCPQCGAVDGQMKNGKNRSGTQTMLCRHCKKTYTLEPKRNTYSEETRALALKIYYAGASGRAVGKVLGMSKANVYNWIKKTRKNEPRGKFSTNFQRMLRA